MYPKRIVLACLWRTRCVNAAMTARSMQEIGMAFALEPALRWLYPDPGDRAAAFARHAGHSNVHPFLLPFLLGVLLHLEAAVARGILPPASLNAMRGTLSSTLSALGDAFFSGAMLPLWALLSSALILAGQTGAALVLTAILLAALPVWRTATFLIGLRHGLTALMRLRQCDLANRADRIKMLNGLAAALLFWMLPSGHGLGTPPAGRLLSALAVAVAAWAILRLRAPRALAWAAALAALILMDLAAAGM